MQRVDRVAPVRARVGERSHDLVELDHRPRPAMRHDDGQRAGFGRADVEEMDAEPVDFRPQRIPAVQHRLAAAPVVALAPVGAERLDASEARALRAVANGFPLGPSCGGEARVQVVECAIRDRDGRRPEQPAHRASRFRPRPAPAGREPPSISATPHRAMPAATAFTHVSGSCSSSADRTSAMTGAA